MVRRALSIVFLVSMVVVVRADAGAADEARDATAMLRVEQASLELGEVVAGTDVTATFVFHNDGDRDIRIIRAKPS